VSAPEDAIQVFVADVASPHEVTGPVQTYSFANMTQGTMLLDRETSTWFLFYRNADATAYGVRTAPVTFR
jgi:hypothetical protein